MTRRPASTCVFEASFRNQLVRALTICILLLIGIGFVTPLVAGPALPGSNRLTASLQPDPFPERNPNRVGGVYDTVDILTTAQEKSIQTDITRASRLGVEMLVYTRMSEESAEESQAFADRLNAEWGVESSDGANDGLVYLVTVNPLDPDTNSVVVSAGEGALPIRQFDEAAMRQVLETEMAPEIADGEFNTAIQFGLRRVLNAVEYSPPSPEPLSSVQQTLNVTANILGAALLQFSVLGFFAVTIAREKRFTLSPDTGSLGIHAACLAVASIIVGLVSIAGRNTFGSLTALGMLVISTSVIPLLIGFMRQRGATGNTVYVTRRAENRTAVNGTVDG